MREIFGVPRQFLPLPIRSLGGGGLGEGIGATAIAILVAKVRFVSSLATEYGIF